MACGRDRLKEMIQPERAGIKSGFAVDGGPSPKAGEKTAFIFR